MLACVIQHIFSPYLSKRRYHENLCDVMHSDVQVRMQELKTRQNFVQAKIEKL